MNFDDRQVRPAEVRRIKVVAERLATQRTTVGCALSRLCVQSRPLLALANTR